MPLNIASSEDVSAIEKRIKDANDYLKSNDRLNRFRRFLTRCKVTTIKMNEDQMATVQQDFVEMRQANNKMTVDDYHLLLVMSRLIAISFGKDNVDGESWKLAKEWNHKRDLRVSEKLASPTK